jgi:hypothetical protein
MAAGLRDVKCIVLSMRTQGARVGIQKRVLLCEL